MTQLWKTILLVLCKCLLRAKESQWHKMRDYLPQIWVIDLGPHLHNNRHWRSIKTLSLEIKNNWSTKWISLKLTLWLPQLHPDITKDPITTSNSIPDKKCNSILNHLLHIPKVITKCVQITLMKWFNTIVTPASVRQYVQSVSSMESIMVTKFKQLGRLIPTFLNKLKCFSRTPWQEMTKCKLIWRDWQLGSEMSMIKMRIIDNKFTSTLMTSGKN